MKLAFSIWVVFACIVVFRAGHAQPRLKFEHGLVCVVGLPSERSASSTLISEEQWITILSVYTREAYNKKLNQPIAGRYSWIRDSIFFEPSYPFASGQTYHAVFNANALSNTGLRNETVSDRLELSFSIPDETYLPAAIEAVYPKSEKLPENLLRMYIHFSTPMMPGEAYSHIRLLREDGREVEKAFLIVDQELWDTERKRFTLLFDPGRIKRDLRSNIELGAPLRKGGKYILVIDSAWRDVHGHVLEKSFRKSFSAYEAERAKISPRQWKVSTPLEGSRSDVVISFDRPIDNALAQKYIRISSPSGEISGRAMTVNDTTWKFTPDHAWRKGKYVIQISPLLEDVCGNNVNNPFDLDLSKERRVNSAEPVEIPLTIGSFAR
jgi:hypothetical protein